MENQNIKNEVPESVDNPVLLSSVTTNRNLIIIISFLAFVLLISTGFLYCQNQQLKSMLTNYQRAQVSPTPTATADPTANWKTYTNTQYEYTIKYPANYLVGFCDELAGEFIESSGSELQVDILPFTEDIAQKYCPNELDNFLRILVFDIKIFNEFDKPLPELADSIYQQQKSHFKTTYISSLTRSKFDGYDNYEYLFSGPSLFMLDGSESVKDGKYKVIFFQKDANVYSLYLKNSDIFNQILSTFKFLGEEDSVIGIQTSVCCSCPKRISISQIGKDGWIIYENGKDYTNLLPASCLGVQCQPCEPIDLYVCPETGWVDCMPGGPNVGVKYECTSEAINWYKANCPNFKGMAQ
ncbi:MAG: hypothetical protein Q8N16_03965 [bacterium]|nr:hypothetical protein [bacterium]